MRKNWCLWGYFGRVVIFGQLFQSSAFLGVSDVQKHFREILPQIPRKLYKFEIFWSQSF